MFLVLLLGSSSGPEVIDITDDDPPSPSPTSTSRAVSSSTRRPADANRKPASQRPSRKSSTSHSSTHSSSAAAPATRPLQTRHHMSSVLRGSAYARHSPKDRSTTSDSRGSPLNSARTPRIGDKAPRTPPQSSNVSSGRQSNDEQEDIPYLPTSRVNGGTPMLRKSPTPTTSVHRNAAPSRPMPDTASRDARNGRRDSGSSTRRSAPERMQDRLPPSASPREHSGRSSPPKERIEQGRDLRSRPCSILITAGA